MRASPEARQTKPRSLVLRTGDSSWQPGYGPEGTWSRRGSFLWRKPLSRQGALAVSVPTGLRKSCNSRCELSRTPRSQRWRCGSWWLCWTVQTRATSAPRNGEAGFSKSWRRWEPSGEAWPGRQKSRQLPLPARRIPASAAEDFWSG